MVEHGPDETLRPRAASRAGATAITPAAISSARCSCSPLPLLATNLAGAIVYQIVDLAFLSRLGDAAMAAVIIVNQTVLAGGAHDHDGGELRHQALVAIAGPGPTTRAT